MRLLAALTAIGIASVSLAQTLGVGDKAPALSFDTVVKGKKVNLKKGVHVVEFWATWCGPCRVSIPHLTKLAQEYKGKVSMTGVSVWERGEKTEALPKVREFVTSMGDKMDYNVAYDDHKTMASNWMQAAAQNGIPAAFIVKDGVIQWIGHPMRMDDPLKQVVAKQWDLKKAAADFKLEAAKQAEEMKRQREMSVLMKPYSDAVRAKNLEGALTALDEIAKTGKVPQQQITLMRMNTLVNFDDARMNDAIREVLKTDLGGNGMFLNSVAWPLIDPERPLKKNVDLNLALEVAQKAVDLTQEKDPDILDTLAVAQWRAGKKDLAIATINKAIALAKAKSAPTAEYEKRLTLFGA